MKWMQSRELRHRKSVWGCGAREYILRIWPENRTVDNEGITLNLAVFEEGPPELEIAFGDHLMAGEDSVDLCYPGILALTQALINLYDWAGEDIPHEIPELKNR